MKNKYVVAATVVIVGLVYLTFASRARLTDLDKNLSTETSHSSGGDIRAPASIEDQAVQPNLAVNSTDNEDELSFMPPKESVLSQEHVEAIKKAFENRGFDVTESETKFTLVPHQAAPVVLAENVENLISADLQDKVSDKISPEILNSLTPAEVEAFQKLPSPRN